MWLNVPHVVHIGQTRHFYNVYNSSAQLKLWCVELSQLGGRLGGWLGNIIYAFFVKRYLRKYSRSEVETLHFGRVWREVAAVLGTDSETLEWICMLIRVQELWICHQIAFIPISFSSCCPSCT